MSLCLTEPWKARQSWHKENCPAYERLPNRRMWIKLLGQNIDRVSLNGFYTSGTAGVPVAYMILVHALAHSRVFSAPTSRCSCLILFSLLCNFEVQLQSFVDRASPFLPVLSKFSLVLCHWSSSPTVPPASKAKMHSVVLYPVLLFLILPFITAALSNLQKRQDCGDGYSQCNPVGATSTSVPAIGTDMFSLLPNLVSSVAGISAKRSNSYQELHMVLGRSQSSSGVCCKLPRVNPPSTILISYTGTDGTDCLLLKGYNTPFCYVSFP